MSLHQYLTHHNDTFFDLKSVRLSLFQACTQPAAPSTAEEVQTSCLRLQTPAPGIRAWRETLTPTVRYLR